MTGNTIAIIEDKKSIAFSELTKLINGTANYFLNSGIKPNEYVALLGDNSAEYVIALYALWRINAIPIPINTRLKENEISAILSSAECNKILIALNFNYSSPHVISIELKTELSSSSVNYSNTTNPNDTAVVIHTSGSSGKPKGVEITNDNLYQSYLAEANRFSFSDDDVFLLSLPLYHIGGFAIVNRALLSGGTLVIPKSLKQNDIVKTMDEENPSIVSLVPTMLQRIIELGINPNSNLRHLFLGGGPSSNELIFTALKNEWAIVKVYGSSETTAMITACSSNELKEFPEAAGKPLQNVQVEIWNEQRDKLNVNEIGEIVVKSPMVAKGYLNAMSLWNKKNHNGYYLTGDYGFLDLDGRLFVVSRRTDLIISGGENINPREVENALLKHDQIKEAVVIPIKDKEWGEIPAAAIVLKDSNKLDEIELKEFLKQTIASYKIPKRFLVLKNIPRTELGKVMFEELKKMF